MTIGKRQKLKNGMTVLTLSLISLAMSCRPKPDSSRLSAFEGNDPSVVISGCRQSMLQSGGIFCRVSEDSDPSDIRFQIELLKFKCKRRPYCADVAAFDKSGNIIPLGGLAKDKSTVSFTLAQLVQNPKAISKEDDGEYEVRLKIFISTTTGEEIEHAFGLIRLIVLAPNYEPLSCNGVDVAAQRQLSNGQILQFTTKLRSAVCPK